MYLSFRFNSRVRKELVSNGIIVYREVTSNGFGRLYCEDTDKARFGA